MTNIDTAFVLALFAIIGNILTFIKFGNQIREKAVNEGKRLAEIDKLKMDLDHAYRKIELLEAKAAKANDDVLEMKGDIKHLLGMVADLRNAFNDKWGGCL